MLDAITVTSLSSKNCRLMRIIFSILLTALTEYRCDSCHTLSPERNCGESSPQSSSSYNYAVSTSDCDGEADRLPTHCEKRAKKKRQRTTFSIDAWSMGTGTNIRAAAIIDAWRRRGLGEEDWDHGQESEDELPQEVLILHWFLVCSSRITVIWKKKSEYSCKICSFP